MPFEDFLERDTIEVLERGLEGDPLKLRAQEFDQRERERGSLLPQN
jgi:hypothetical protein